MSTTPLVVGGVGTGVLVGGAFGARHAFEADHVAAVATLVEDHGRPALTGAAWGLGHSLPILVVGAAVLLLDLTIPPVITAGFETLVAVVLVGLGVHVLAGGRSIGLAALDCFRGVRPGDGSEPSAGGGHTDHTHPHRHQRTEADRASLAVGVVHGLAGSGGVMVVLATSAPTAIRGAAFLAGFAAASVAAMGAATWLWGRLVSRARLLRVLAGAGSVAVGLLLGAEVLGVGVPG